MTTVARERLAALDSQNPWPGLEQFHEEDALFFRGRDAEADELLALVSERRFDHLGD